MIKQPKQLGGTTSLFWLTYYGTLMMEAEAGGTLLIELLQVSNSATFFFLNSAQDHMPRGCTAYGGLDPPTSTINQENAPQICL